MLSYHHGTKKIHNNSFRVQFNPPKKNHSGDMKAYVRTEGCCSTRRRARPQGTKVGRAKSGATTTEPEKEEFNFGFGGGDGEFNFTKFLDAPPASGSTEGPATPPDGV